MDKRDYYEILGIDRDADEAAIKRVFRTLAMRYHPDRNPGDGEAGELMKEINEAYAVLSDPEKRRLYDLYGHAGLEGFTQEDIFGGVDFASLFREFGLGGFGFGDSLFDSFFGRRRTTTARRQRAADLRYDLELTLEEAAFGTEKTVSLPRLETCPACRGTGAKAAKLETCPACRGSGQMVTEHRSGYSIFRQITPCRRCQGQGQMIKEPCPECAGKGLIRKTEEMTVSIPKGADTGHTIRVGGKGEAGKGVVEPGDLYLVIKVAKHPIFERHGDDLYLQKDITFAQAALGAKIKVPSLDGDLELEIPEGTETGAVLQLPGKGVTHLGGNGRGDQYVIAKVVTPTDLSKEEKHLLREFEKLRRQRLRREGETKHG